MSKTSRFWFICVIATLGVAVITTATKGNKVVIVVALGASFLSSTFYVNSRGNDWAADYNRELREALEKETPRDGNS